MTGSPVARSLRYPDRRPQHDRLPVVLQRPDLTTSQFTTSSLPIKTMWWRVRAIDAAGPPGPCSIVQRFEVES